MSYLLKNAKIFDGKDFQSGDVLVNENSALFGVFDKCDGIVIDASEYAVLPGFVDVHVHFREPGFSYKETVRSGSRAAAAGGYTDVCTMPNLNPVPDSVENLKKQTDIIDKDACINVVPFGSITVGEMGQELADMAGMKDYVAGYSDDGRGVQSAEMMERAMTEAKKLDKVISAHCEDNSLLHGGYINDGEYAKAHGHRGISNESEYKPIMRDIELVKKTGVKYHVCHISAAESADVIRKAKAEGVDITCETGPHYLVLSDNCLEEDARFKMNPPLRSEADRLALVEALKDGTIDMIATDHAPHSDEEKSRGLEKSAMGVVGLETAFSVMYTHFVKNGIITMEKLMQLMHYKPLERFGFRSDMKDGSFTVFNLNEKYTVNPDEFNTKGRATPFTGMELFGRCIMTFYKGELVWKTSMM